jgi:hypothetical protein
MASTSRTGLSSVFDEMVANNKKRFDDLFAGERSRAGSAPAAHQAAVAAGLKPSGALRAAPPPLDPQSSPAVRRLNERFGNDWRYEIADQQRDGDEAIVLCKLTFGKDGSVRTQFGRAQISQGQVAGASGGVQFRSGALGAQSDENDAFRRATEAALMNCIDLI